MPLTMSTSCGMPHDPVYNKIKKDCGHNAVLLDTSFDFKWDITIANTAGNVAKEASDDLNKVKGIP